ncbi:MAG: EamA/RhaT family transporter [Rubripirellula sp.]
MPDRFRASVSFIGFTGGCRESVPRSPLTIAGRLHYAASMHLLLPLLASVLLVCGLILIKRAGELGATTVTTLFLTNVCSSFAFSFLWLFGGSGQPLVMLWQPAVIAALFWMGLTFTYLAIERGDVSIATPVLGVKVVFVAILVTSVGGEALPRSVWIAAVLAASGIGLIQWTGRGEPRAALMTIGLASCAAGSFATFDVLVQSWAPNWGAGRILPIAYWFVGLSTLALIPWVDWSNLKQPKVRNRLVPGAALVALQAICIVVAVGVFGDAVRVNVIYALRAFWGVALAWSAAKIWGGVEADHGNKVMLTRAFGACLLTAAVVMAVLSQAN